tara:strand:- start:22130 stop:22792 length:663 start_codon:yes stop_codon:yes gene_type:complete
MTRKVRKSCKLCQHPERDGIEEDILAGNITCDEVDKENNWWAGTSKKHMQNHLGEYHDGSNPSCTLCTHPNRAELEIALSEGTMKISEAAEILSCSEAQVQLHIKKHLKPIVQQHGAMEVARMDLNEIDILSGNVNTLQLKVNELLENTELGTKQIDSLTKLAKEIRESLKYMLEFKGQLVHKREETVIVQQVEIIQKVLIEKYPEVWTEIRDSVAERLQ